MNGYINNNKYINKYIKFSPEDEDELILLFVKMKNGSTLDDALRKKLCTKIRYDYNVKFGKKWSESDLIREYSRRTLVVYEITIL